MKSIQTKILAVVISALMVMTAVVAYIGVESTHSVMHMDADRILDNMCQKEAALINDTLNDIEKAVSVMVHFASTEIKDANSLRDPNFRNSYLQRVDEIFSEIVCTDFSINAYYFRINPDLAGSTSGFWYIYVNGVFKSAPLTDLKKYTENDTSRTSWYYTAVSAGEGVWMQPYFNENINKTVISFVSPVYCDDVLIGTLGIDIDFNRFVTLIDQIPVYKNGVPLLLGEDGTTVLNTVPPEKQTSGHNHDHSAEAGSTSKLVNGMSLRLVADYKDIQRDIRPVLGRIVHAFLIVLLVVALFTIWVTRKLVAPLKRLTAAAKSFDSNAAIPMDIRTDSKDEIGTLSRVLSEAYSKLREYTSYINALAYRDSLTGIKNRTAYAEAVDEMDKRICHGNPNFAVLVADINNLKCTNDRFGHDIGNELIIQSTKIMADVFKHSPIFRIGGDEFVVILEGKDFDEYRTLLDQMDAACASSVILAGDEQIQVSLARGVALFNPNIDNVFEDVFNNADHAMYMHKQNTKSTIATI